MASGLKDGIIALITKVRFVKYAPPVGLGRSVSPTPSLSARGQRRLWRARPYAREGFGLAQRAAPSGAKRREVQRAA